LDTIKKSASVELPGKIAFTSSRSQGYGEIDFDNLNLEKGAYWYPLKAYGNTKLMVKFCLSYLFNYKCF
jgi:retinol dehydrogenase-13